jgi:ankyrin repeat protein
MANVSQGLFKLPNELLLELAALLGPAYLRRLSQVNHRLLDFALDYSRTHVSRLAALADDIVLRIVAHLGNFAYPGYLGIWGNRANVYQSQLAQASHRFYPLVMDAILREEVRTRSVRLMNFALTKRRIGMVKRLLQRGADVEARIYHDTRFRFHWTQCSMHCVCFNGVCLTLSPLSIATSYGDVEMAKLLLNFGADVHAIFETNVMCCYEKKFRTLVSTPLLHAAYRGHEGLVQLLLQAGASPVVQDSLQILSVTITERHEHIVLLLLQALDSINEPSESVIKELFRVASEGNLRSLPSELVRKYEHVILRRLPSVTSTEWHQEGYIAAIMELAVAAKLVKVVDYLAQLETQLQMEETGYLDSALYKIISYDTCRGEIRKRELHQEVYQIVETLLAQGANPDASGQGESARDMASTHPDPRVRNRLLQAAQKQPPKDLASQVGRSWVDPSQASPPHVPRRSKRSRLPPPVNLWDFVKPHNRQGQSEDQESDVSAVSKSNEDDTSGGQVTSALTSISTSAVNASGDHTKLQSPPTSSNMPSILPPKSVWAEIRSTTTPASAQARASQDHAFPALSRPHKTSMANIKSSSMATAAFRGKTEASKTEVKASDTKQTYATGVGKTPSTQQKSGKSLKGKKKWEKLVLS